MGTQVALYAAAPGSDESKIESAANGGAGERDEACDPFFSGFGAEADGKALDNHGTDFFDELFFSEVLAEIDSRCSGSGKPKFALLFFAAKIETIKQTKALDQTKGDDGEEAGVRDERNHTAETEARALQHSEALRVTNQNGGDGVQSFCGELAELPEISDTDTVLFGEVAAKVLGVDLDGAQAAAKSEFEKLRKGGCESHGI